MEAAAREAALADEEEEGMLSPGNPAASQEKEARERLAQTAAEEGGDRLRIALSAADPTPASSPDAGATGGASPVGGASPASMLAGMASPVRSPRPTPKLRRARHTVTERVTVFHLKQFLAAAFGLRSLKQLELRCVGAALGDDMSLEYVSKTHWRGKDAEVLALSYTLKEF